VLLRLSKRIVSSGMLYEPVWTKLVKKLHCDTKIVSLGRAV